MKSKSNPTKKPPFKTDTSLRMSFENDCAFMPGFNSEKNESGDYKDVGTQTAWEGYRDAEEWKDHRPHQKVKLSECPEPLDGWCDCEKSSFKQLHKVKNIYVCLGCLKKTEPFLPANFNSSDWLPHESAQHKIKLAQWIMQEEIESGENAYIHPNTEYFKVMREINIHEDDFIVNSGDLIRMAEKHSLTYRCLNSEDKEFVNYRLDEEFFSIEIDED